MLREVTLRSALWHSLHASVTAHTTPWGNPASSKPSSGIIYTQWLPQFPFTYPTPRVGSPCFEGAHGLVEKKNPTIIMLRDLCCKINRYRVARNSEELHVWANMTSERRWAEFRVLVCSDLPKFVTSFEPWCNCRVVPCLLHALSYFLTHGYVFLSAWIAPSLLVPPRY